MKLLNRHTFDDLFCSWDYTYYLLVP